MRQDVYVGNDSGGLSVLSSSVVERVVDDARNDDKQFVAAHEAILGMLAGDSAFVARVVVGEALTADEQEQWIAHYRWALKVPCGRLLLCGGLDPDGLAQWLENGESGYVREVAVPKGHYIVDVYTYLHTMNGRVITGDVWKEKLGAWFRRDHARRAFPSWVAGELCMFPDEDPGHEKQWGDITSAVETGQLNIETEPLDWVGFLFHMQPFDARSTLTPPGDDGWFAAEEGLRKPARFPLGVPADTRDPVYRAALEELIGADDADDGDEPPEITPFDVLVRTDKLPLAKIEGGPVEISPKRLASLYRLAWFATAAAIPELRVEGENAGNLSRLFEGWPNLVARGEGRLLRLSFPQTARWGNLGTLEDAHPDTWTYFASGSVLELATFPPNDGEGQTAPPGSLRFRGVTEGRVDPCVWKIAESYPPVDADTLRAALALSEAAENGKTLVLASPEEAQQVHGAFSARWGEMLVHDNPVRRKAATIGLKKKEKSVLYMFAAEAFRARYARVWPCFTDDDEQDDK
jgi:hypothetical protein